MEMKCVFGCLNSMVIYRSCDSFRSVIYFQEPTIFSARIQFYIEIEKEKSSFKRMLKVQWFSRAISH